MRNRTWWALAFAGSIAASGCAGLRGKDEGRSQASGQIASSQERSAQALGDASEAQQRAADQARRAEDARQDVQEAQRDLQQAQQRLAEAQQKAQQEQQKAQQLQQEANQATQAATRQAQQGQRQATQALARQGERVEAGQMLLSGQVTRSGGEELAIQPEGGGAEMTFRVDSGTQVIIDGRQGSAGQIQQGADARVAYEVSQDQPTALRVDVLTGAPPVPGDASGAGATESGTEAPPGGSAPQPAPEPGSGTTTHP